MLTKVCTICAVEKSVDEYYKKRGNRYGVATVCKCCEGERVTAQYLANKEKVLEQRKAYYRANKEALLERGKAYHAVHRDAVLRQKKAYRQANKGTIAQQKKAYYEANKEAIAAKKSAHQKANPHIFNALNAKRKATKLQATPTWADSEAIKGMYQLAAVFNRTGMNLHVDHIVPLQSDLVCGLHCESNLQLMPASDNISKSNRHWSDMPT